MCPCPVCATIAILLAPFYFIKKFRKYRENHHKNCECCQNNEKKQKNN